MSETIQIQEPIYKLGVRFGNGEVLRYVVRNPIDERSVTPDTRYLIITSISCQNPSQCTEITVVNMRDVTYIKTERVTLEQLANEHRMVGIPTTGSHAPGENLPETLAEIKFV
jgi:hypothetical protein